MKTKKTMTKEERAMRRRKLKMIAHAQAAARLVERIARMDDEDPWAMVEKGSRHRLGNFARRVSYARC